MSWDKRIDKRNKGSFDNHEGMCAICALRSHHVWKLRSLDLKGESLDVRGACDQCKYVVGRRPLVYVSLVPHVFLAVVVIIFVVHVFI